VFVSRNQESDGESFEQRGCADRQLAAGWLGLDDRAGEHVAESQAGGQIRRHLDAGIGPYSASERLRRVGDQRRHQTRDAGDGENGI
jgi:hypothetical protein